MMITISIQIWRAKRTKYTFYVQRKASNVNTLMSVGSAVIERNVRRIMGTCNLSCRLYFALRVSKWKKWIAVRNPATGDRFGVKPWSLIKRGCQGTPVKSVPVKQNKKQVSPQYHQMSYGAQQDKLRFFSSKNLTGQAGFRVQGWWYYGFPE